MLCKMLRVRYEQPRPAECKTLRHYTDPGLKFARGDLVRFACMEEQPLRARVRMLNDCAYVWIASKRNDSSCKITVSSSLPKVKLS